MMYIKDLINKIKWDENYHDKKIYLEYLDRVSNKLIKIKYERILDIEDEFMILFVDQIKTYIPLHRIKKVWDGDRCIWNRYALTEQL